MRKLLFAAAALAIAAPATSAVADDDRYWRDHRGDHREHRQFHREYDRDHREAHWDGFYSRRDHREWHRDFRADHHEFHDDHPGTRHDRRFDERSGYGYRPYGYARPYGDDDYVKPYWGW